MCNFLLLQYFFLIFYLLLASVALVILPFIVFIVQTIPSLHPSIHAAWGTENLLPLCSASESNLQWVLRVLKHQIIGCDSLKSRFRREVCHLAHLNLNPHAWQCTLVLTGTEPAWHLADLKGLPPGDQMAWHSENTEVKLRCLPNKKEPLIFQLYCCSLDKHFWPFALV